MRSILILSAIFVALFAGTSARAELGEYTLSNADITVVILGDPVPDHSFIQNLRVRPNIAGSYDLVGIQIYPAGGNFGNFTFESPALSNFATFSSGGVLIPGNDWALVTDTAKIAAAAGSDIAGTNFLQLAMHFNGTAASITTTTRLRLDFAFFNGNTLVKTAGVVTGIDPSEPWITTPDATNYWTPTRDQLIPIPAPGALVLGSIGITVVGLLRRRFSKF